MVVVDEMPWRGSVETLVPAPWSNTNGFFNIIGAKPAIVLTSSLSVPLSMTMASPRLRPTWLRTDSVIEPACAGDVVHVVTCALR